MQPLGRRAVLSRLLFLLPAVLGQGAPKIHCVALVTPNTYEPHLLAGQWRLQAGVSPYPLPRKCDSFDIYSNVTASELFRDHADVAKELANKVHNLGIPLFAPMAGARAVSSLIALGAWPVRANATNWLMGWDPSDGSDVGQKAQLGAEFVQVPRSP
eukprot:Skav219040  [mRNA]  locus=scaffold511:369141:386048:+ [translate_table: standard]